MSNDYFNHSNPLARHTLGRAGTVNGIFEAIASGFQKLPGIAAILHSKVAFAADTGTANAYAGSLGKPLTAYEDGTQIRLRVANSNTGASTLDVDGLGPREIKLPDGTDVGAGDLIAGETRDLIFSTTGNVFTLQGLVASHEARIQSLAAETATNAVTHATDPHVPGQAYTAIRSTVTSLVNLQTYRAITTHSGEMADPSVDPTNWKLLGTPPKLTVTVFGTTPTLDLNLGSYFKITLTGDTTIAVINPPAAGELKEFSLEIVGGGTVEEWDIANAATVGSGAFIGGGNTWATAISSDGTKFYTADIFSNFRQYTLSTPWDLSTATDDSITFSTSAQTSTSLYTIVFSADGSKMYAITSPGMIHQYTLSTPWAVATATYDIVSFNAGPQTGSSCYGACFANGGTKMYLTADGVHKAFQYTLSTAWDVSTATYDSVELNVGSQASWPLELAFNTAGTRMVLGCRTNRKIYQYTLSTPFLLSTASYDSVYVDVLNLGSYLGGVAFAPGGVKAYPNSSNGASAEYTVGTDLAFTMTYPDEFKFPDGLAPPTTPGALSPETDIIDLEVMDGGATFHATKRGDNYS